MSAPNKQALDFPFDEVLATVRDLIRHGNTIYQKWTCGECGRRCAMNEPNRLFEEGECEHCGYVTNIKQTGCNYRLVAKQWPPM
jgi:hypothetical protein